MQTTRVDLHVKILDETVVERAKSRGIDVLVYAPHFTRLPDVEEKASTFSDEDLLIVPAREIFTGTWRNRKHVLALDLESPVPDFITLPGAMRELRRQDALVLVPHPELLTFSLVESDLARYRDQLDGIEVYNTKYRPANTRVATGLARRYDLDPFGSSYAHHHGSVGEVWTEFDADIETETDLYDALRNGVDRRVFHRSGPRHSARRAVELGDLVWENTYEKLDRVLLSGLEPTHPHHIAYDGRFEDVAVY
ncbi:MAG: PHP domain-containing protein [Halodesulfurarchaeum sp.]